MGRNYNSKKTNSKNASPLITARCRRFSLEDGKDNESMGISSQKPLLKDYAVIILTIHTLTYGIYPVNRKGVPVWESSVPMWRQ